MQWVSCSSREVGESGRDLTLTTRPNLALKYKKVYSYTSTPLCIFMTGYRVHLIALVLSICSTRHKVSLITKGKAIPVYAFQGSREFQGAEDPRFRDRRHMKGVRLAALHTGRLNFPGNIPGTHFCYRLSRSQGYSAAGKIISMKNSNYKLGNRTRNLRAASEVLQPTVLSRAVITNYALRNSTFLLLRIC
jgi:hypothetical protein